jgi:uncharacterized membrane protein YkvA (DUF1232 family)
MNHDKNPMTETDFHEFIERGAAKLTQREVHRLVAEMPELREQFSRLRESDYPDTERQLWFLSEVVDQVWTEAHLDLPYGAALEAAFAVAYFIRDTDLIPDLLGPIGLTDDIAIVQAVFARNADAYAAFRAATKLDWADFKLPLDRA